jgi:hypothetical protein
MDKKKRKAAKVNKGCRAIDRYSKVTYFMTDVMMCPISVCAVGVHVMVSYHNVAYRAVAKR